MKKKRSILCFVCRKPGHFAYKCWFRNQRPNYEIVRGKESIRGRGYGRGRGRRGNFSNYRRGFNQSSDPSQIHLVWGLGGSEDQTGQNGSTSAKTHRLRRNLPNNGHHNDGTFKGFMFQIKFRTSITLYEISNFTDGIIDSGGSHHLFYSRLSFKDYNQMVKEPIKYASGQSFIVGHGSFVLPIAVGAIVIDYNAPQFSTNIIYAGQLSDKSNIFSFVIRPQGHK